MSIRSVTTEQPEKVSSPSVSSAGPTKRRWGAGGRFKHLREKVTTRHGWVGDYDYAWLCMPTAPWRRSRAKQTRTGPPFYALDSELPIILAAASGLQHALAMLAGLITPPIIFANALSLDSETSAYMISASLIGCGECTQSCTLSQVLTQGPARSTQSGANVAPATVRQLFSRHWPHLSRRNKFCHTEYSQRRTYTPYNIVTECLTYPLADLQCYVRGRHLPVHNRRRWNCHARSLS